MSDVPPDSVRKPKIHQSQLGMIYSCPLSYKFAYVDGFPRHQKTPLVLGTAVHASVEANLRSKMDSGDLLPIDAVKEAAASTVKRIWGEEGVKLSWEERKKGEAKVRAETIDTAVSLAMLHHNEVAPNIEPIAIEKPFLIELAGFPVDLGGTMDVETVDTVRDTKTYKQKPNDFQVSRSIQLSMYGLAKKTMDGGVNPRAIYLDVLMKKKKPEYHELATVRNDRDYETLLRRVEVACDVIQKGAFSPCDPEEWCCSEKHCDFYNDVCEFGRRSRTMVSLTVNGKAADLTF